MKGEFNVHKFGAFLKSFWGLLASFTVVLPTIIYLANTAQVKASVLSEYYLGVPTTFALLVIPFSFLFEDKLSDTSTARITSSILFILALTAFFSFLVVKNVYMADRIYRVSQTNDTGRKEISESINGLVVEETYMLNMGLVTSEDKPIRKERRTNVLELVSLALYTSCVIFLTAAFSGLGVFFYTRVEEPAHP